VTSHSTLTPLIVGLVIGFLFGLKLGGRWVVHRMIVTDIRARIRSLRRKWGR
jgi:hypothetical protein